MKIVLATILALLIFVPRAWGLDPKTHEKINLWIAQSAMQGFSLNDYLINELDVPEGTGKVLRGWEWMLGWRNRRISNWIKIGGLYEDKPPWGVWYVRSLNHFHNPITNKGFAYAPGTYSAKDWALMPVGRQILDGNFSWYDSRDYFYKSLTLPKKEEREEYFAGMFRALGQVMHLVQDMSVPEHTRDDAHVLDAYEEWVASSGNLSVAPVFFAELLRMGTTLPIANLFDVNQYNGTNPGDTTGAVGLAEYTNANFVSVDTVEGSFPYPKTANASIVTKPFTGPTGTYDREYFLKNGDGETNEGKGYLLCVVDINEHWRSHLAVISDDTHGAKRILDENVYEGYSKLLLPRAIGYSAALFRYFFRGRLDVEPDQQGIKVTNKSSEDMQGSLELYYDDPSESRKMVTSWSVSLQPGAVSPSLTFTAPTDADKFILVFKGQLGKEQEAVVGKVFSVSKPFWTLIQNFGARGRTPTPYIPFYFSPFEDEVIDWSDQCPFESASLHKVTFNYECPGSQTPYTVWLVSSSMPLWDDKRWTFSCDDDLEMKSLGQFSRQEIFTRLQFMRYYSEIWWRKVSTDADCLFRGEVTHRLHEKGIRIDDPWIPFTWVQYPQSDSDFTKIKDSFGIQDSRVGSLFRGDDFEGDENVDQWYSNPLYYSSIYSSQYHPEGFLKPSDVKYADDETVCVPFGDGMKCYPIVGTIPSNAPVATMTGVIIEIR